MIHLSPERDLSEAGIKIHVSATSTYARPLAIAIRTSLYITTFVLASSTSFVDHLADQSVYATGQASARDRD